MDTVLQSIPAWGSKITNCFSFSAFLFSCRKRIRAVAVPPDELSLKDSRLALPTAQLIVAHATTWDLRVLILLEIVTAWYPIKYTVLLDLVVKN